MKKIPNPRKHNIKKIQFDKNAELTMSMYIPIRLFNRHKLINVFTPSTVARLTYIKRDVLECDVEKYIEIPGMQLILFGHSGCGKSTLICNKLDKLQVNYIKTSCKSDTTLNDLILYAFDKLNVYYDSSKTFSKTRSIKNEISLKYKEIGGLISAQSSLTDSLTANRVLPLQLTPQRLAEFQGAANCIWIIEDFHKVSNEEKKKIADVMKIFMDAAIDYPTVKIICIGAVGTARELLELESNLSNRVAETLVPLLLDCELAQIVDEGFHLMNVSCDETLKEKIIYYSNNLASVCHQICFDMCHNRNMMQTNIYRKHISENDFKKAVASYVRKNSDTITKVYSKISLKAGRKHILQALINISKPTVSSEELFEETKKIQNLSFETYIKYIDELMSPEFGEVLRIDHDAKRYFYSNPFFQTFVRMQLALEASDADAKAKRISDFPLVTETALEALKNQLIFSDDLIENYIKIIDRDYELKMHKYQKSYELHTNIKPIEPRKKR